MKRAQGSVKAEREAGATRYEGAPCATCGSRVRLTSNHKCVACKARRRSEKRSERRASKLCLLCEDAAPKSITATYCEACSALMDAKRRRINASLYYERHRELILERKRLLSRPRGPCEICQEAERIYHSRLCRPCVRAYWRLYHRSYQDGVMVTGRELEQVKPLIFIYRQAALAGLCVDHVVPPNGCRVCGRRGAVDDLDNLQIMSIEANAAKRDRCQACWEADRA